MQEITDASARKLGFEPLNPGELLDLLEAAEGASGNQGFVGYASVICSCREIDGVPEPFPRTRADIRALANRLGTAGLAAMTAALSAKVAPADGTAQAADVAKN